MQDDNNSASNLPKTDVISWTSTETISQKRSGKWYAVVVGVFVALLAVDALLFIFGIFDLMALICTAALLVAMFVSLMVSTKLPTRESSYVLSNDGLIINGQNHPLSEFRAFGVRQHGGLWQLVLIPVRRFGMEIVSYIDEQNGEKIVDILANFLPMEEVPENGVDRLIDRLKI